MWHQGSKVASVRLGHLSTIFFFGKYPLRYFKSLQPPLLQCDYPSWLKRTIEEYESILNFFVTPLHTTVLQFSYFSFFPYYGDIEVR